MSELAAQVDHLDSGMIRLRAELTELRAKFEASTVDVDRLRLSPRVVAAIAAVCLAIAGGMWASTYGLRSDVRDILSTIESQKRLDEVNQRLADQQTQGLVKAIDTIDKRQQLQAIELQDLKEMVLRQGASK